jgi:hypothetical protein
MMVSIIIGAGHWQSRFQLSLGEATVFFIAAILINPWFIEYIIVLIQRK